MASASDNPISMAQTTAAVFSVAPPPSVSMPQDDVTITVPQLPMSLPLDVVLTVPQASVSLPWVGLPISQPQPSTDCFVAPASDVAQHTLLVAQEVGFSSVTVAEIPSEVSHQRLDEPAAEYPFLLPTEIRDDLCISRPTSHRRQQHALISRDEVVRGLREFYTSFGSAPSSSYEPPPDTSLTLVPMEKVPWESVTKRRRGRPVKNQAGSQKVVVQRAKVLNRSSTSPPVFR